MDLFAYPQRNLPGRAEDWGRAVEAQQRILSKEVRQVNQAWENSARATGGQLAVIASQIDSVTATVEDLSARAMHSTSPDSLTLILGSSSGEVGPVSREVPFPAPESSRRNAIIVGSGNVAWTGTSTGSGIGQGVTVGIEFRQNSSRIWYDNADAGSAKLFSFISGDTFNLVVPVQVPATGSSFDLRMWVGASSSGGQAQRGARLENMNFSIIYGDTY